MCGIVGIASTRLVQNKEWLATASRILNHRGPDSHGEWWSENNSVGFAHRRLAIIDLSLKGHQPMVDKSNKVVLTYNGEIYNYKKIRDELKMLGHNFRSNSDTEVVLNAYKEWGTSCFKKFNGMFAMAIYDINKKMVYLARDIAGEKPLFYNYKDGCLRFASELKSLICDNNFEKKIDLQSLECYFSMGFVLGERCILQGYKKLPASSYLEFDLDKNKIDIKKYWEIPNLISNSDDSISLNAQVDNLEELLFKAVKKQMVSDVPVGILLSGGLDSSLITAMAARTEKKINTFNIKFSRYGTYDESDHAKLISQYFDTNHYELDGGDISTTILNSLVKQFDEPVCDSSMIPTFLVTKLVKNYCTVAIGGDGGDELFGGYMHYPRLLFLKKYFSFIPLFIRNLITSMSNEVMPIGFKGRNWINGINYDFNTNVPQINLLYDKHSRLRLFENDIFDKKMNHDLRKVDINPDLDFISRAMQLDFQHYLREDILVKTDRTSMLNSLELRSPMLDKDILEFAFNLRPEYKVNSKYKKIILNQLAKKILPKNFSLNRKQGFSIPLNEWLKKGEWLDYFQSVLLDASSPFNQKFVRKLIHNNQSGYSNSERLFSLVFFDLWRREYNVTF